MGARERREGRRCETEGRISEKEERSSSLDDEEEGGVRAAAASNKGERAREGGREAMRERLIKEMSRAPDRPMLLLSQRTFWDGLMAG